MIRCVKKDFFSEGHNELVALACSGYDFFLFSFAKQSRGEITGQSSADVRRVCELC